MIFFYLFFLPPLFTLIDFVQFLFTGKKAFNYFGGLVLDIVHLVCFPVLFISFSGIAGGVDHFLFEGPVLWITVAVIILSVIGYFAIQFAYLLLSQPATIIVLTLLACGVIINIAMLISHKETFIAVFNIPIILLYIMQIVTHSNKLVNS